MAGGTIHAALIMGTDLPILPAKARVAVTASTQVGGAIHWHRRFGMIGGCRSMAGFAGHAFGFVGRGSGIVSGGMTDQTGAGLALLIPLIHKDRIAAGLSMWAVLPAHLELCVADSAIR